MSESDPIPNPSPVPPIPEMARDKVLKRIARVHVFQTSDGERYTHLDSAISQETLLVEAAHATKMLVEGHSVGAILRTLGRDVLDPVLDKVTKDSKLVIEYWQCRGNPGYQPVYFTPGMRLFTYGDAGSWSGSYGGIIQMADLIRYAKDFRSILSPKEDK